MDIITTAHVFVLTSIVSFFMQAFGQSFLQSDIGIFRQNLQALESLNSKHKLFHKVRIERERGTK